MAGLGRQYFNGLLAFIGLPEITSTAGFLAQDVVPIAAWIERSMFYLAGIFEGARTWVRGRRADSAS